LNEQHRKAYRAIRPADADSKELKPKDAAEAQELTRWMCANFFDIRTFGAVMTTKVNTLYRMDGYISAYLAGKTGFSEDDLSVLWEALMNLFEHDRSASRGQMAVRKLVAFEHSTALGQAPAHVLLERVSVRKKTDAPARSFSDYELVIDREGLPEGVELVERG